MAFTSALEVETPVLRVSVETAGRRDGPPVILLHGFPYDVRAFDDVATQLADAGRFVVAPFLRGFGATRFLDSSTMRSGQQAAIGQDVIDLMDALGIETAVVAGFDWGGRGACIAAALFPDRVAGLVTVDGYSIQDIAASTIPEIPADEKLNWYQFYFHSERGRRGLERHRDELCALLWKDWSPTWSEVETAFAETSTSLHNPDFVEVVIHSYRHRYGLAAGDPRYEELEARLADAPAITVPTVVVEPGADGVAGSDPSIGRDHFTGDFRLMRSENAGHNLPQQDPIAFAEAVLSLTV